MLVLVVVLVLDLLDFCSEKGIRFPVMILFRRSDGGDIRVLEHEHEHEHEEQPVLSCSCSICFRGIPVHPECPSFDKLRGLIPAS